MSSSRIIKVQNGVAAEVTPFSFGVITPHGVAASSNPRSSDSFTPLGIFDANSYAGENDNHPEEEDTPPGVVLSEEEFNQRISESFQNGLREGQSLAERGLINVFRSLRTAAEIIQLQREKVLRESEDDLLNLVMMVAGKVINREVAQDRKIVQLVIRAALEQVVERDEIMVRVNADDYVLLTTGYGDFFVKELESARVRMKADPAIQAGGCAVDTTLGTIDASIASQLEEIYRRLLEERNNQPETS